MIGLDQVLVDMITIIIGGVGLIGAITRFDVANSKKAFYGENPFARKEQIINDAIVRWFTGYAAAGLFFQLILGSIYGDIIPDRLYPRFVYVIGLVVGILCSYFLIKLIRWMSKELSKDRWQSELVNLLKENYISAIFILENNGQSKDDEKNISENKRTSNYKVAENIIARLEELFEIMPLNKDDIMIRANRFRNYFKMPE